MFISKHAVMVAAWNSLRCFSHSSIIAGAVTRQPVPD